MITLRGTREVGFDDVGSGLPVVLLHAFPLHRAMWGPQVSGLVQHCRCVALDFRGFGESSAAGPYSIDQYADDVAELLDVIGIDQAVIGGISMGGYVALAFYRRHRMRVRALMLADTRAAADTEDVRERRRALIRLAEESGVGAVADAQIASLLSENARGKSRELADTVLQMMCSASVEGLVGALEAMMTRSDATPLLAEIDVPTLIVRGKEDSIVTATEASAMHDAIRGSVLELIPEAGHLSNVERPAAFNHTLGEFIGTLTYA